MRVLILTGCVTLAAACATAGDTALPTATALGEVDGQYLGLSYSPDGARVAFWRPATDSAGGWRLWMANADLTGAEPLPVRNAQVLPAVWSPDGSRLASPSSDFGTADIVVVPSTGGAPVRVTSGAGLEFPVAWLPDGDQIVHASTGEGGQYATHAVSVSTGALRRMLPGEARTHLAWPSPDGSRLAVLVYDPPRTLVFVTDSAGANARPLLNEGFELVSFTDSPWSPDGRHIVFESRRTGTADLWIAPADSGEPRQLTHDVRNDFQATWSPDGNWVAFVSERGRQTDVWVVPSAGGEAVRITDSPLEVPEPPRWRPGTVAALAYIERAEQSGVWAMNLADGAERRLTPDSVRVSWFNVSSTGDRVSLVIPRGGGVQDLVVAPVAGGAMNTVVTGGTVNQPWWSPTDSLLVYGSDRSGSWDVWVVDPNGGAPRNVVAWPESYEFLPGWTRNGSIVFQSDRTKPWGDAWLVDPAAGEARQLTRSGSILQTYSHATTDLLVAAEFGSRAGELTVSVLNSDGSLKRIWDSSNVFVGGPSPDGQWVTAMVEQPDGQMRGTLVSARGLQPRVLLNPGEVWGAWSRDGTRLLYTLPANGTTDLGMLTLADGSRRRLTTTPEAEEGAEFAADGNTVVFRRTKRVERLHVADLSRLRGGN